MEVVYSITNTENNKRYIGSTIEYDKRVRSHLNGLRGKYHENRKLQKDFNKYGEGSFVFEIIFELEDGSEEERFRLEEELIERHKTYDTGYNLSYDGRGRYIMSEETREIFRENNSGKNNGFYGKTHSEETRRKLSEIASARTGDKNPFFGQTHTKETKERISKSIIKLYNNGWKHPQKGVPKTEEQKRNNMIGQPKRKEVIAEGERFSSISQCAKSLGISRTTVRNRINNERFPGYYFIND